MSRGPRYVFLDVLRGIAVLWMIQVHVTNVFLWPSLRSGWFFEALNISNGFVAPAFLFCAGSGLWIALSRKGADYLKLDSSLALYLRRLAYILFWAFLLHIPVFSLRGMFDLPVERLVLGWQVDILQTIVYTSLVVLTLFLLLRDLQRTAIASGILAAAVSVCTVWLWPWVTATLTEPLAIMLTPRSPFPLFPWMAYLLAGVFVTDLFMRSDNKTQLAQRFILFGAIVPVIVFFVKGLSWTSPWTEVWWQASPSGQLFRICGILLAFGALFLIEDKLAHQRAGNVLQTMGMESLFLYLSHLMLVYGNGPIITRALLGFDQTDYLGITLIWAVVTIPLVAVAYWWHRLKKERPQTARWVLIAQICWITLSFLLTPPGFRWMDLLG